MFNNQQEFFMNIWHALDMHVDKIKETNRVEGRVCYLSVMATLKANIAVIFLELSIRHPEAFESVLKELRIKK